ncbi:MAG: TatD family hydrolase [Candidatus Aminicenantia bacterium]
MILIDSHAHLDSEEFDSDREEVINRALKKGVKYILTIGDLSEQKSIEKTLNLSEKYENIFFALGLHPHQAGEFCSSIKERLKAFATYKKRVAVGEIGLDFYYHFSSQQEQIKVLEAQLDLAQALNLPVIIHSRQSGEKILKIIKEKKFSQGGILHCFTEDLNIALKMIEYNFLISFSGILTFPKAENLRQVAREIPLNKLLIETDCPYLAPVPYRGKRNEPAYLIETARKLAGIKEISLEETARITIENFKELFKLNI